MKKIFLLLLVGFIVQACEVKEQSSDNSALTSTEFYQTQLFEDVQLAGIFADSKTFVDCTPKVSYGAAVANYEKEKGQEGFDLAVFVKANFDLPEEVASGFSTDTTNTMIEHINSLWPVLTRQPQENTINSSLFALPNKYIVPGGRFREIYYWDSYFTIEGLLLSDEKDMAKHMADNFSYLIDTLGFIPNGNRSYYSGRSQPPFYSLIIAAIAQDNRDQFISYLPYMRAEYNFWMKGEKRVKNGEALNRVVKLTDGAVLNRYWDDLNGPRPESYKEDYELVTEQQLDTTIAYKNLRAGAESGWDYSSRWFADKQNMATIQTTDIVPIDLNSLMYHMELKIAQGYNWKGQLDSAQYFLEKAEARKQAIQKYLWSEEAGMFMDLNFRSMNFTGVPSLAGAYPLYFNIASKKQAKQTVEILMNDYLMPGGFVTTLNNTGQQWDYPNGWAPLQWITVMGMFNYEYNDEGLEAIQRWLKRNRQVYEATGKMMEKYNVVDTTLQAGGGEYPLQDGFGWTNGVAVAFQYILDQKASLSVPEVEK